MFASVAGTVILLPGATPSLRGDWLSARSGPSPSTTRVSPGYDSIPPALAVYRSTPSAPAPAPSSARTPSTAAVTGSVPTNAGTSHTADSTVSTTQFSGHLTFANAASPLASTRIRPAPTSFSWLSCDTCSATDLSGPAAPPSAPPGNTSSYGFEYTHN
ncbi:hypothetical protein ACGFYZ_16500 [Streptomyces sp. NPDC048330]|uniref:hypothetical protein n=1 Tax=Streptomyces sp. NPDC048330 TaxID=3365533 RepID=UPI0037218ABC